MAKRKILIGNWKMKPGLSQSISLAKNINKKFSSFDKAEVVVCPNFIALSDVKKEIKDSPIKLGAQNVFWEQEGSYTGEISPKMLAEVGCEYVIIGHSERRQYFLENHETNNQKIKACLSAGLTPVVCIGESASERELGFWDKVLMDQLGGALNGITLADGQEIIVAYEPVWAIGSGVTIEPQDAVVAHEAIEQKIEDMFFAKVVENNFRIIYGGSINGENVKDFASLHNVDGLLVGGSSLDAEEFYKIAEGIIKQ